MEAKKFTWGGLAAILISILPIVPLQYIIINEILQLAAIVLGIISMRKGDKHGGLIILLVAIALIVQSLLKDYILNVLAPLVGG